MSRPRILLILAIWVAVLPYLGFPIFWKNVLFTVSGLMLAYISFLLYKESRVKDEALPDSFRENFGFREQREESN